MDTEPPASHLILPKHGGYRRLRSFKAARLVFDATVDFCDRFIEKSSRTHDQMVQAVRLTVVIALENRGADRMKRYYFLTDASTHPMKAFGPPAR